MRHRGVGPLDSGDRNPSAERCAGNQPCRLQRAASIIGEVRWEMERLAVRLLGLAHGLFRQRTHIAGELLDGRIEIDVLHGHRRDLQTLADLRAEPGHEQRMGAKVLEKVILN